jgi:hypothetical protein
MNVIVFSSEIIFDHTRVRSWYFLSLKSFANGHLLTVNNDLYCDFTYFIFEKCSFTLVSMYILPNTDINPRAYDFN